MEPYSKLLHIFVAWLHKAPRPQGEQLSFDPSENLENSKYAGEKSESCSSCSSIYIALFLKSWCTYIPAGVSRFSFLRIRVFQNLQTENVRRLTLFVPY